MTYPADQSPALPTLVGANDIETVRIGATTARLVAPGSVTRGDFGLFRWEMPADAGRADPHLHRTFSESFYVLEGAVRLWDGSTWRGGRAGDFLYVPIGAAHGFANESGEPATMLILFSPGVAREQYFRELAEIIASGRTVSAEERTAMLARHDQYMV